MSDNPSIFHSKQTIISTKSIILILGSIGLITWGFGIWYYTTSKNLLNNGIISQAKIVDCDVKETSDIDDTYYWFTLTLSYDGYETQIKPIHIDHCRTGEMIEVAYSKSNPQNVMLTEAPYLGILIGCGIAGTTWTLLFFALYRVSTKK